MIKWPEPAWKNRYPPNPLPTNYYTEAQLKQAVRDALEEAAKVCDEQAEKVNSRWIPKECAIAIRARIKEIE